LDLRPGVKHHPDAAANQIRTNQSGRVFANSVIKTHRTVSVLSSLSLSLFLSLSLSLSISLSLSLYLSISLSVSRSEHVFSYRTCPHFFIIQYEPFLYINNLFRSTVCLLVMWRNRADLVVLYR